MTPTTTQRQTINESKEELGKAIDQMQRTLYCAKRLLQLETHTWEEELKINAAVWDQLKKNMKASTKRLDRAMTDYNISVEPE